MIFRSSIVPESRIVVEKDEIERLYLSGMGGGWVPRRGFGNLLENKMRVGGICRDE